MDPFVTPYRICTCIFIKIYSLQKHTLLPRQNGDLCLFILKIIRQNEYSFRQLSEMINYECDFIITRMFVKLVDDAMIDINRLFEIIKQLKEITNIDNNSVSGLYLRKVSIYFNRLTHQAVSRLFDDLVAYVSNSNSLKRLASLQIPRTTRSSGINPEAPVKGSNPVYQINHEIAKLQANEQSAMNPKDLHESLRRPNNSCKSDATFLRYLNLLRVNESVGSKHLLFAYFDMVSDSVSRSYSALNYAIWYLHHGEYRRAIECLQECYCCAQAADDDKCLLIALMWLARILIQAKQKNSQKYNVRALLELVRKRSHKAGMAYVEAMASLTLEQLNGPIDDSEILKQSSEILKQVAQSSKQQNHLLTSSNQPNPLDKEDQLPSAEILAVRNSMNDVLAMNYALQSAHFSLMDANHSSALASQALLHFDLIEKCGDEYVFLLNENIFIAIRNLAHHVWNLTKDIQLVSTMLVDLCSSKIPIHRTDNHAIWRQALSEISFEHHIESKNWSEAQKMISIIRETDPDGAQLRQAELLQLLGAYEESLSQVDELVKRIEYEESNPTDPVDSLLRPREQRQPSKGPREQQDSGGSDAYPSSLSIEHRSFIKSKALLLRAVLLKDEVRLLESLNYATENKFMHVRVACLTELAVHWVEDPQIFDSLAIEVFANGTSKEKKKLLSILPSDCERNPTDFFYRRNNPTADTPFL